MSENDSILRRQFKESLRSKISIGDTVTVYSDHVERITGTVLSLPQATGDCWIIKDVGDHELHYVQTFARITKEIA